IMFALRNSYRPARGTPPLREANVLGRLGWTSASSNVRGLSAVWPNAKQDNTVAKARLPIIRFILRLLEVPGKTPVAAKRFLLFSRNVISKIPPRGHEMKSPAIGIGFLVAVVTINGIAWAQTSATTIDGLIGAAKTAAGTDWAGTFLRLCIPPAA